MSIATIEDALELAITNFRGLTDKDGEPYIMHCLRVMMGVSDLFAQQVAVMHDLVEDTDITLDDLRQRGFSEAVVTAVALVTHSPGVTYAEYVVALKSNELARQVKMSDLRDNAALNRVLYRKASLNSDLRRLQKYLLSYQFLSDRIDEVSYLQQMRETESQ